MPHTIALPIRYLAEFLLRGGSIDSRFSGLDRGAEGSRLHRRLQKQGGKNYEAEVPLAAEETCGEFCYQLSGRADGIITEESGVTVDEIKTTPQPLEAIEENQNPAHWAQGCLYAHILCGQRGLAGASVRLTYCNTETLEVKRFAKSYTAAALAEYVQGLLRGYEKWARLTLEWKRQRTASLQTLAFPFGEYRGGQRRLAVACYQTFKQGGRLFCCAPTGIGKTMSTLFPALKAMGEGYGERIFYLTAKTIARTAAEQALQALNMPQPLALRSLTLTAKDKICFLEERACLPESCPYANGYYDRINDAVYEILQTSTVLNREELEALARRYSLCPYELSLDLALWSDCVVCDYNYLFDPVVHLQRFFEGKGGDYLFLIDEAHNLAERGREMYSAQLKKAPFFEFKKQLPKQHKRLHKALTAVNSAFIALRRLCEEAGQPVLRQAGLPQELQKPLEKFTEAAEIFLEEYRNSEWQEELLALYFDVLFYARIAEGYSPAYTTLIYKWGGDVAVRLFCLDPSAFLNESLAKGRAAVLFSATLRPLPYYRSLLGNEQAKLLSLGSPFSQGNMGLFVADGISTKYQSREGSLGQVAEMLAAMVAGRAGNYIAYFPSYAYLRQVLEKFEENFPRVATLVQKTGMGEQEREAFLAAFSEQSGKTLLGFCVLGGLFAEGVDLAGNRLIGTAVVGVGLPQIGPEQDSLRDYFDGQSKDGFEYAYQFPGMNKVLQAAGRVIRTEADRGVVLLIDSRFTTARYQALFPPHWGHWQRATAQSLPGQLAAFWQGPSE